MIRILAFLLLMLSFKISQAQQNLDDRQTIIKLIENATSKAFDRKSCKNFEPFVFSTFITYSEQGIVENVFISDCNKCIVKDKFIHKIKEALETQDEKKDLSNRFVISIVYVAPDSKTNRLTNQLSGNWESIFSGIDMGLLQGKEVLFSVPVSLNIIPTIHN